MSKLKSATLAAVGAVSMSIGSAASAAEVIFEYEDPDTETQFSFIVDQEPTPDSTSPNFFFQIDDVSISGDVSGLSNVVFYTGATGGGFYAENVGFDFLSQQLFSGTVENPQFVTGTYCGSLSIGCNGSTLSISAVPIAGAVPEPSTWAMLLLGFFGVGASLRRKSARSWAKTAIA